MGDKYGLSEEIRGYEDGWASVLNPGEHDPCASFRSEARGWADKAEKLEIALAKYKNDEPPRHRDDALKMPTLDEIREEWTEHDLVWQEKHGALLMRAVEQLGTAVQRQRLQLEKHTAARYAIRDMEKAIQTSDEHYNALIAKFDDAPPIELDVLELISAKKGS